MIAYCCNIAQQAAVLGDLLYWTSTTIIGFIQDTFLKVLEPTESLDVVLHFIKRSNGICLYVFREMILRG